MKITKAQNQFLFLLCSSVTACSSQEVAGGGIVDIYQTPYEHLLTFIIIFTIAVVVLLLLYLPSKFKHTQVKNINNKYWWPLMIVLLLTPHFYHVVSERFNEPAAVAVGGMPVTPVTKPMLKPKKLLKKKVCYRNAYKPLYFGMNLLEVATTPANMNDYQIVTASFSDVQKDISFNDIAHAKKGEMVKTRDSYSKYASVSASYERVIEQSETHDAFLWLDITCLTFDNKDNVEQCVHRSEAKYTDIEKIKEVSPPRVIQHKIPSEYTLIKSDSLKASYTYKKLRYDAYYYKEPRQQKIVNLYQQKTQGGFVEKARSICAESDELLAALKSKLNIQMGTDNKQLQWQAYLKEVQHIQFKNKMLTGPLTYETLRFLGIDPLPLEESL